MEVDVAGLRLARDPASPPFVLADPALTVGLPPPVTAATGMDAFAHCLEAYCAPFFHPYADGIALEGMRLVKEYLARAVADGKDMAARAHMLAASQMGSTAFQKGLGAIHSLSHPVGEMAEFIERAIEDLPADIAAEVTDQDIALTGGGALLDRLDLALERRVGAKFKLPETPMHCVIRGSATVLAELDKWRHLLVGP